MKHEVLEGHFKKIEKLLTQTLNRRNAEIEYRVNAGSEKSKKKLLDYIEKLLIKINDEKQI